MMMNKNVMELINPLSNLPAFGIYELGEGQTAEMFRHSSNFSLILILNGQGRLKVDTVEYPVKSDDLLSLSLYQSFEIISKENIRALMINFHPDFFCLHEHRNEVSCNGVLFNNIYESPVLSLDLYERNYLVSVFEGMKMEMKNPGPAQLEALIAYLKIFLINASRIKIEKREVAAADPGVENELAMLLKRSIENYFKSLHRAGDYADLLRTTTTVLNRASKLRFRKTLSALIIDRIITEAKRKLYLTTTPVKIIGYELGFTDEFYFSRLFKSQVGVSPQFFRESVGSGKSRML